MENVQQILNDEHKNDDRLSGMKERASDAYDEVKDRAEELKDSVLGATQSNEERFEHEVGHRADELAECIDDQCTCDVLGASGELFHHCRQ